MKLFYTLSALLISSHSWAGIELHGGNVLDCKGKPPVLLEYYEATLGTIGNPRSNVVTIPNTSVDEALDFLIGRISAEGHGYQVQLRKAIQVVGNVESWIASDLETSKDLNLPYPIPAGCEVRSAAVRTDNQIMYGNPEIISRLSQAQLALLVLHEAIYMISQSESALPTRDVLRWLLKEAPTDAKVVQNILKAARAFPNPALVAMSDQNELVFKDQKGNTLKLMKPNFSGHLLQVVLPEEGMRGEASCRKSETTCELSFSKLGGGWAHATLYATDQGKALEIESSVNGKTTVYHADLF